MTRPVTTRPCGTGDGLKFREFPNWTCGGAFTDDDEIYFILEPDPPPPPEPNMDAIRAAHNAPQPFVPAPILSDPNTATTRVVSGTAGLTYWRGRFVRLSANYVLDDWSGSSQTILGLKAGGSFEQEFLLRFAASL